jgi:hypothetical protein
VSHFGRVLNRTWQAAEKRLNTVILSAAKNLGSCSFNELRRSFVACGSPESHVEKKRLTCFFSYK